MAVMPCRLRSFAAVWTVVACVLGHGPALAGAWPLGEGEALVIAGASFSGSTAAFDASGKLLPVSAGIMAQPPQAIALPIPI